MKKILVLFACVFSFSSASQAGILLEPYFNYIATGKLDSNDISGNELGARLGWGMAGFSIGIDALVSGTHTYKDTSSTSYTPNSIGVFAAYQFPILIRGYVSYAPSFYIEKDSTKLSGTSTRLGVQYTGLPFLAIGVETQTDSFKKSKVGSTESDISETASITSLVISVPFNL